jgi:hypothetical protein
MVHIELLVFYLNLTAFGTHCYSQRHSQDIVKQKMWSWPLMLVKILFLATATITLSGNRMINWTNGT